MTSKNGCTERTDRLPALRRFAAAITLLNLLGHSFLGFEQSLAQPLVALGTAYAVELALELAGAWSDRRAPRFLGGGLGRLVEFLLPAHITALACAMLLYANDRLGPIAFAAAVGVGSKALIRISGSGGPRHVLNPSNTGIAITLLAFPWVGIAPPYMFTENLSGIGDWFLPLVIVLSGTFLNTRFTGKVPLILGWVGGFVLQALVRAGLDGVSPVAGLLPMTGVAFLLFTFYMVTDPGTTPRSSRGQFAFGAAVAAVYGLLMAFHVVFGLFFSLLVVCSTRGIYLALESARGLARPPREARERPMVAAAGTRTAPDFEVAER